MHNLAPYWVSKGLYQHWLPNFNPKMQVWGSRSGQNGLKVPKNHIKVPEDFMMAGDQPDMMQLTGLHLELK